MDGAEAGPRRVPGQRRALEVVRVPHEQFRVLRSQIGTLDYRAGCDFHRYCRSPKVTLQCWMVLKDQWMTRGLSEIMGHYL